MPHLVLVGDSILDNAAYTEGGPAVIEQVRERLPTGWKATLLAVDGAMTVDVDAQLARLPDDATHLVVSVGGNDALAQERILQHPVSSMPQAVAALADVAAAFEASYRTTVAACVRTRRRVTVCTIYNGWFDDATVQRLLSTLLMVFNDVIVRVAVEHALPLIDLRAVCAREEDYANPIEPSSVGGEKIAKVIVALVTGATVDVSTTRILTQVRF